MNMKDNSSTSNQYWKSVLSLDEDSNILSGTEQKLIKTIQNGADLRIYTEFRHNEHLDTNSDNEEIVEEVSEFGVTYLLDNRWIAGIMSLRQPIEPPLGFGPRPSMSFFLYNQNGQQAIARPYLDGKPSEGKPGKSSKDDFSFMPKYQQLDNWDAQTNAPSHNFKYRFDIYRFCVRDDWKEVYNHHSDGKMISGSYQELINHFKQGCEVKVGIRNLCNSLNTQTNSPMEWDHEVFIQVGPCYHHTSQKLFVGGSHPVVRVSPNIPLQYSSQNWDFGWLMVRTDGFVASSLVNPQTLKFFKQESRHQIRWFVR